MYYDKIQQYDPSTNITEIDLKLQRYPCSFTVNHDWGEPDVLINDDIKDAMQPILKLLKDHSDIQIKIESHTDSSGDATYNLDLSLPTSDQTAKAPESLSCTACLNPTSCVRF